jgi:uncharacterized protein (TIGR01777 family)
MSHPPSQPPSKVLSGELFVRRTRIAAPAADVFAWHARPGALERLTPPWERVEVLEKHGGIENGARVVLRMGSFPLTTRWVAEHRDYVEGEQFRDVQIAGPFARWEHTHRITPDGAAACYLEDAIEYALPFGAVGALGGGAMVRRRLARMFEYRHRVTAQDIAAHARAGGRTMKVLVTGASGLIGSALVPLLTTGGHDVLRLVRNGGKRRADTVQWDPVKGTIDAAAIEGVDAVVHLAGESVAGRWTAAKKAGIYGSRVDGTRVLVRALTGLARPPKVLVAASAIGYYGDRGADVVDEDSAPGAGFLAEVAREWEAATQAAAARGIRAVNLRFGVVLSPAGGALATMLPLFRLGAGGPVGSGDQYMSWVALDDAIGAILHALTTPPLSGPVNVVAPNPVTNREFTKTLGRVLSRPAVIPMPAFVVKLAFGEMGESLLLASTRVEPHRLKETGYPFRFPELEGALRHLLGKPSQ